MGEALKKWLKLKKKLPVREEALLNVRVAVNFIDRRFENIVNKYGITSTQYNVLRILKGVYPEGHPRGEIMNRMIERAPDITRLIDRLEMQGLVKRDRIKEDRRQSITKITEKGIEIVNNIQPVLEVEIDSLTKKLNKQQCYLLSVLSEKIYEDEN